MTAYRRSLVKATVAGVLLCGLWFVPSAKAAPEHTASTPVLTQSQAAQLAKSDDQSSSYALGGLGLVGGASLLGVGAVLITYRSRSTAAGR